MSSHEQSPIAHYNLTGLANLGDRLCYAADTLEGQVRGREIAIIPHAGVDMDIAKQKAETALAYHGVRKTISLHERPSSEARYIFENVDGVYIAGGNTFALVLNVAAMRNADGTLIDTRPQASTEAFDGYLKEMADKGLTIMGTSAGLMIMGRDIRTCSDSRSFVGKDGTIATKGLDLLPFSFHPHFEPERPEMVSELSEYPQINPEVSIIAIQNESFLTVQNGAMKLHGVGATLFDAQGAQAFENGADLSHLVK